MQTKEYSMTLDMKRTLPFRPFEVVEGDTGNVLHITLQNDGEAMDLSGCGLCIVFASSAGFAIQDLSSGVWRGEGLGEIVVRLNPAAYGAGNVSADVQVYSGENDETLITSTRFDFRCRRSMISEDIIRANTAYPPLVTAAEEARAAAAAALAAAERIDAGLGERNVQADWAEADTEDAAYIRNRPLSFPPSAHSGSHASGSTDPLTPSSIGAAAATHASRHGASGADPLTPGAIGAATASAFNSHAARHAASGADPLTPGAIGAAGLGSDGKVLPYQICSGARSVNSSRALNLNDAGGFVQCTNASAITLTVPSNDDVAFPQDTEIEIAQFSTGSVTIAPASGVTLLSFQSQRVARTIAGLYGVVALKKYSANYWILSGALA